MVHCWVELIDFLSPTSEDITLYLNTAAMNVSVIEQFIATGKMLGH